MAAVPAGAIAERRVIMRLLRSGAVSADTAAPLEGLRWIQQRRLRRLINAGVVHEPHSGHYYLDPPALADRLTARRQAASIMLLVVIAIMAALLYFGMPAIRASSQAPATSAWPGWDMVLGEWIGDEGHGVPGSPTSSSFSFSYDLDRQVIVRRDRSDYPATGDRAAFRHEGLMVVSADSAKHLHAMAYDNEGHAIPYDVAVSDKRIVFTSPEGTTGPRFRLTYLETPKGLAIRFEIAPPDHPDAFATYVEGTAHRASPQD